MGRAGTEAAASWSCSDTSQAGIKWHLDPGERANSATIWPARQLIIEAMVNL
jgi:hypothetical protein